MFLLRIVFLLGALAGSTSTMAMDLYQGEAAVGSADEASRANGVVQALRQVLVKVSGDPRTLEHPAVTAALGNASSLMQRYEYRQELQRDAEGRPQARLFLVASFYPSSVDDLLSQAGLQIWGRERPRVLVLIESEHGLLERDQATALVDRAATHGLSLRFSQTADAQVVRQLVREGGTALSSHFGGSHVLYGVLGSQNFLLDNGREARRLRVAAGAADAQMTELADALRQALVSTQLSGSNEPQPVQVWVEGVQSARDYARVLSYLSGLTPVRTLNVAEVQADRLLLDLVVAGGDHRLQQTVEVGRLLDVLGASPLVLGLRAH